MGQEPRTQKSPRLRPARRIARLVGLSAIALVLAYALFLVIFALGAGEPDRPGLPIENRMDEPVNVILVRSDGAETIELMVPPGERRIGLPCDFPRVARTEEGRLVAEWSPPPDCSNNEPWIIAG